MHSHAKIGRQIALGGASLLLAQACTPAPRVYPTQQAYAPAYAYRPLNSYRPAYTYPYRAPAAPQPVRVTPTSAAPVTDEGITAGQVLVGAALVGVVACIVTDCLGTSASRPAASSSSDNTMRGFLEKRERDQQAEKRFDVRQADWINKFYGSGQ